MPDRGDCENREGLAISGNRLALNPSNKFRLVYRMKAKHLQVIYDIKPLELNHHSRKNHMSTLKCLSLAFILCIFPVLAAANPPTEESIKQLLITTDAHKQIDNMLLQMDELMKSSFQRAFQGQTLTPKQQKIIDGVMKKNMDLIKQELI